ncbi:MAG: DUF4350 domain-containing protein [Geothermobacteraceae bacterium]
MKKYLFLLLCLMLLPAGLPAADRPVVRFDQGHGQAFRIDQQGSLHLTDFARLLLDLGAVAETGKAPLDRVLADQPRALVLSGVFQPLSAEELDAVVRFVEQGGRLAVMLHIAPPVGSLLHRLGVNFSNGVVREQEGVLGGDALNFRVTRLAKHPLFTGVDAFNLYGGWALNPADDRSRIIARTGPRAWVDLNGDRRLSRGDAMQSFAVVVTGRRGKGEFVIFADDAIFQNRFLAGNRHLAENLARWLLGLPTGPSA